MKVHRYRKLRTYSLSPGTIDKLKKIRAGGTPSARAIDQGINMYYRRMRKARR